MAKIDLRPARLDYKMMRGDDFADTVTFQDDGDPPAAIDVSTRTFTAQVRSSPDGEVVASMVVDMTDADDGIVVYSIADTVTDEMSGDYVWDFQQDASGSIRTLMGGKFVVLPDVTHA